MNEKEDRIWAKLYGKICKCLKSLRRLGKYIDSVRSKGFLKNVVPNWSKENFKIKKRIPKKKPVYKLTVDLGDDIQGQFYEEELQPIRENSYAIERILRKRKSPEGTQEFLIKWKGWTKKSIHR